MTAAESKIQGDIIKYLLSIKAYPIKIVTATEAGNPDLIACYKGQFIAIEVKRRGEKAQKLQLEILRRIIAAGGHGIVVDNLDTLKEWLSYIDQTLRPVA